jgi:D-2-hydroxyacid dehydrogenase (NADP+)
MRVLIHLSNPVRAFQPSAEQLGSLARRLSEDQTSEHHASEHHASEQHVARHELVVAASDAELLTELPLADAVVVWSFRQEWYARAPRLRHLFTPSAGQEPFALDPSGRVQRHFGRFHGAIMAESLLAMITFMNRRMGAALAAQAEGRWDRTPYSECRRLHGQTVLIIGFGAIGERCGRLLSSLGMVVHGLRREPSPPSLVAHRLFTPEQRVEAVRHADHIVCVLPGDTGTDQFVDAELLSHLSPRACVYNLGRGNAIDAEALARALSQGQIAGAFLDVQPEEPLPAASPLWTTPNLYLTPHSSAIGVEYLDLYFEELASELGRLP